MKEAVNLEEQLEREREARLAEERALVAETRASERETLQAAYEQVGMVAGLRRYSQPTNRWAWLLVREHVYMLPRWALLGNLSK